MTHPSVLLFMWGPADGLPSASAFCLKNLYGLRFKKIPHRVKYIGGRMPPWVRKGRLPVAEIGEEQIEDSSDIMRAIDRIAGERPLYPADPALRAEVILLEDWADEALFAYMAWYRWASDANFRNFANQAFARVPVAVKKVMIPLVRKQAVKRLRDHGFGMHSDGERKARFLESLDILDQKLASNPFLTGEKPNAADLAVLPHLQIALASRMPELLPLIEARPKIMAWMRRVEEEVKA